MAADNLEKLLLLRKRLDELESETTCIEHAICRASRLRIVSFSRHPTDCSIRSPARLKTVAESISRKKSCHICQYKHSARNMH